MSDNLTPLIERVEAALIRATDNHFVTSGTTWRSEAAEYATILTSLRALQHQKEAGHA